MNPIESRERGIFVVDSGFQRAGMNAVHLLVDRGRAAVIDTGVNASVPRILAALGALGLDADAVDWVCLTHVHLDHAGGAGALMRQLPVARLVVHPRGARHMIDPARLVAGTTAVYGEETMQREYGEILPIDSARVVEAGEGSAIHVGARRLEFIDTPGHARHHVSIRDEATGAIFTGDTFGFCYWRPELGGRHFVFPTTTPVQFDPVAAHSSVERIAALDPPAVYLTHYSRVSEVSRLAADLHRLIDLHVAVAQRHAAAGPARHAGIVADLRQALLVEARANGWTAADAAILALHDFDLDVSASGLEVWLDRDD